MDAETTNADWRVGTAAFLRQLVRFRRRLGVLEFSKYGLPMAIVALVGAGIAVLAVRPAAWHAAAWFGGSIAVALVTACAIAWIRTPSMRATAAMIDRHFHLEDRVVTALQFAGDADGVSRLIVSDASAHLARCAPKDVSGSATHRAIWLALFCGGAALLYALAAVRTPSVFPPGSFSSERASSTDGQDGPKRPAIVAVSRPAGASASAAGSPEIAKAQGREAVRPGLQNGTTQVASSGVERATGESILPRQPSGPGGSKGTRRDASGGSHANSGSGGAAGTAGRSQAGGERGSDGSGSGGGTGSGTRAGAGGVKGGLPASPTRRHTALPIPAGSGYSAQYRNARTAAEAAIDQGRVPPILRRYIRDYFLAIQPTGRQ